MMEQAEAVRARELEIATKKHTLAERARVRNLHRVLGLPDPFPRKRAA